MHILNLSALTFLKILKDLEICKNQNLIILAIFVKIEDLGYTKSCHFGFILSNIPTKLLQVMKYVNPKIPNLNNSWNDKYVMSF